jgi:phage repressor protein C with HTH and peptisase S24 domain
MIADPVIAEIDAALRERGLPRSALGREIGLGEKQLNRLFNNARKLQRHELDKIRAWLWPGSSPLPMGGTIVPLPGMVPLYGSVGASSENRLTLAEQSLRAYVPMHPSQRNLINPFALEVSDISMSPRYEPGEIVYVAPNRWPAKGQDCVLVTRNAEGFLKRYLNRDETTVYVFQLNPEREIKFVRDELEAVHAVVGRG